MNAFKAAIAESKAKKLASANEVSQLEEISP